MFPYCINEWNKVKVGIRNALNQLTFSKNRKKKENLLFCIYDPLGVKLLTRLRLQFGHLNEHKFKHGFSDTINPMCACGTEAETSEHFLSCVVILTVLLKDKNFLKILRKLNQILKV